MAALALDTLQTYRFDFATEVARARIDYPAETEDIAFLDMSQPSSIETLAKWIEGIDPQYLSACFEEKSPLDIAKQLAQNSAFSVKDPVSGVSLLGIDTNADPAPELGSRHKQLGAVFNHELAHLVIKGAAPSDIYREEMGDGELTPEKRMMLYIAQKIMMPTCENLADGLGAMLSLKQNILTPDDLAKTSLERAYGAVWNNDTEHLTSMVLDTIAADALAGKFTGMTPQDLKAQAQVYASTLTPPSQCLTEINDIHRRIVSGRKQQIADDQCLVYFLAEPLFDASEGYTKYTALRTLVDVLRRTEPAKVEEVMVIQDRTVEKLFDAMTKTAHEFGTLTKIVMGPRPEKPRKIQTPKAAP